MTSLDNPDTTTLLQSFATSNPALYTHFTSLITHLIQYQPEHPFDILETLSAQLKQTNPTTSTSPSPLTLLTSDSGSDPSSSPSPSPLLPYLASTPYLFLKPPPPAKQPTADGEEEEAPEDPEIKEPPAFLPNLLSHLTLLSEAGLALPAEEILLLDRAIILFAQTNEHIDALRYFGKVHTTNGFDYHILEVKQSDYTAEEEALKEQQAKRAEELGVEVEDRMELLGSGTNEYIYYVTQCLDTPAVTWTALPVVTPRQLAVARTTRRFFTGELTASVGGFPPFPGNEAVLLRCQVARITHGSVLAPAGSWKEEEGEVVIEDEEWRGVTPGSHVTWVHSRLAIRPEGRVEPWPAPEADAEDPDAAALSPYQQQQRAADAAAAAVPKIPQLREVSQDRHTVLPAVWTYRTNMGVDTGFKPGVAAAAPAEGEEPPVMPAARSHVVSSAQSLLWPGSCSAVRGKEYVSVYVGWGLKYEGKGPFRPAGPAPRMTEWVGVLAEQADVGPTAEEVLAEKEAEEEKKKEKGEEEDGDQLPDDEPESKEEEES